VESAALPIDVAIPCALLLSELITNAAKHAFVGGQGGELGIVCRRQEGTSWLLEVRNSARAAAQAPVIPGSQGSSFGLELVRLLTEQLNGTVHIERAGGFCVSLVFPLPEAAEKSGEES